MKMNTNMKSIGYYIAISAIALAGFSGCSDDETVDKNSPAYLIKQSESLTLPAAIDVPQSKRIATFYAKGVQKYKAQAAAGGGFTWVFVAPEADLFDKNNNKVGTHFAGPSWKIDASGDLIVGQQFSPARTASVDPASIDWLLLLPKTDTAPSGIFLPVHDIQRIATTGGRAPSTAPTSADATVNVPYTAIYRFLQELEP